MSAERLVLGDRSVFEGYVSAGFPVARLVLPGLHQGDVVVVAENMDGSLWVRFPRSDEQTLCVHPTMLEGYHTRVQVQPANGYQLSVVQQRLLVEFFAAGRDGLADFELSGAPSTVSGHRLALATKGLIVQDPTRLRPSPAGAPVHVWTITVSGRQAVRPACPAPRQFAA